MRMTLSTRNTQATVANFRAFDEGLQTEVKAIVQETGQFVQELAAFFCPVDTSPTADDFAMRDHIRLKFGELGYSFEVGWEEEDFTAAGLDFYPIFLEWGTVNMAAQPSLFPAHQEAKPRFIRDVSDAMRRSAQRSGLQ